MNSNEHLKHWGFRLVEAKIRLCIYSKKSLDSLIITLSSYYEAVWCKLARS